MTAAAPVPRLDVVLATDDAYFPGALVTATSLALSCDVETELRLHVLDGGLRETSWQRLRQSVTRLHPRSRVERIAVADSAIFRIKDNQEKSPMAYARLLAPKLIDTAGIVYLDSDCLVLGDLTPLATIALNGAPCGAARDPIHPRLMDDCPWASAGQVGPEVPYFNSGVLVIDVPRWNQLRITERTLDLLDRDGQQCRFWDQTALNFLLRDKWFRLPREWNLSCNEFVHDHAANVRVIHFLCLEKPWFGDTGGDAHAWWRQFAARVAGFKPRELQPGVWRDQLRRMLADRASFALARWFALKRRWQARSGRGEAAAAAGWASDYWQDRFGQRQPRRAHAAALAATLAQQGAAWERRAAQRSARPSAPSVSAGPSSTLCRD